MVQQKIVIKVHMSCDKCRSKALAVVAATGGVDSVALAGDDQVVVVGEGIDSIKLTGDLRKKVGPAQLMQVGEAKEEKKPAPAPGPVTFVYDHPWQYPPPPHVVYEHPYGYGYQTSQDSSCSIM
ncbi:hypothetical protein U9M48_022954 [Paspalum notatum var. saurae]|uniref:HMA domain-containing protein n=1 Tax=Paspalum notatum var. saurae TaxID=547442 RepID=A0AAQ3TM31_PASNO